jgi:hypothetical protein
MQYDLDHDLDNGPKRLVTMHSNAAVVSPPCARQALEAGCRPESGPAHESDMILASDSDRNLASGSDRILASGSDMILASGSDRILASDSDRDLVISSLAKRRRVAVKTEPLPEEKEARQVPVATLTAAAQPPQPWQTASRGTPAASKVPVRYFPSRPSLQAWSGTFNEKQQQSRRQPTLDGDIHADRADLPGPQLPREASNANPPENSLVPVLCAALVVTDSPDRALDCAVDIDDVSYLEEYDLCEPSRASHTKCEDWKAEFQNMLRDPNCKVRFWGITKMLDLFSNAACRVAQAALRASLSSDTRIHLSDTWTCLSARYGSRAPVIYFFWYLGALTHNAQAAVNGILLARDQTSRSAQALYNWLLGPEFAASCGLRYEEKASKKLVRAIKSFHADPSFVMLPPRERLYTFFICYGALLDLWGAKAYLSALGAPATATHGSNLFDELRVVICSAYATYPWGPGEYTSIESMPEDHRNNMQIRSVPLFESVLSRISVVPLQSARFLGHIKPRDSDSLVDKTQAARASQQSTPVPPPMALPSSAQGLLEAPSAASVFLSSDRPSSRDRDDQRRSGPLARVTVYVMMDVIPARVAVTQAHVYVMMDAVPPRVALMTDDPGEQARVTVDAVQARAGGVATTVTAMIRTMTTTVPVQTTHLLTVPMTMMEVMTTGMINAVQGPVILKAVFVPDHVSPMWCYLRSPSLSLSLSLSLCHELCQ